MNVCAIRIVYAVAYTVDTLLYSVFVVNITLLTLELFNNIIDVMCDMYRPYSIKERLLAIRSDRFNFVSSNVIISLILQFPSEFRLFIT